MHQTFCCLVKILSMQHRCPREQIHKGYMDAKYAHTPIRAQPSLKRWHKTTFSGNVITEREREKREAYRDCECSCLFIQSRSSLLRKVSVIRQGRRGGNEKRSLWGISALLPSKTLFPQIAPHSSRHVSVVLHSSALLALHNGRDLLRGSIIASYPECFAPRWPF